MKKSIQIPITLGYRMSKLFSGLSARAEKRSELLGLMVNDPHISPYELSVIQVPTLVLAGTKDLIPGGGDTADRGAYSRGEAKADRRDHFIAAKAYEAFNAAVEEFLDGISGEEVHSGEAGHGA